MSSLSEDIKPYLDAQTGLIAAADGGRDNLELYTAELIELLTDPIEKAYWAVKLGDFLGPPVYLGQGCFDKYPGAHDNSIDNIIGIARTFMSDASLLFRYGKQNYWCFNPTAPGKFAFKYFYWYHIGFVSFVKHAAGCKINIFQQFEYVAALIASCFGSGTSNVILQWLMNRTMKNSGFLVDIGINLWQKVMMRKYPGGMSQIMGIYNGVSHPFATYSRKDFV